MPRSIAQINPALRKVIRGLLVGLLAWPLYLFGAPGLGKTRTAICALDVTGGTYWELDELADAIMQRGAGEVFAEVEQQPLCVLDELGCRSKVGDLHYNAVRRFADTRERVGCRAIYCSNLSPSELAGVFDSRVSDRLTSGVIFDMSTMRQVERADKSSRRVLA